MAELKTRATLDGAQFQSGISRLGGLSDGLKSKLAGAFTVGAIGAGVRKMMEYADSVEELSQRAGVLPKQFQEWVFGAKQNGADAEKLVSFIERLTDAAQDMKNAGGFAAIGINPNGMTPGDLFAAVQSRTAGKGATEIQSMLQNAGMSFKAIGPMVNMLSADMGAAAESARRMGAVIDDSTIHSLAVLNDQLSITGQVLMGNFAPALISAGKMALTAFANIKGGSGYFGAMTAKMSLTDIILAPLYSKKTQDKLIKESMPDAAMQQTAANELLGALSGLDEALKRISTYTPPPPPTITQGSIGASNRMPKQASDSLLSVGNFLGAGRNVIDTLQREANRIAKDNGRKLDKIAENTGGKKGSIIVPR